MKLRSGIEVYKGPQGYNPGAGYLAKVEYENLVAGDFKTVRKEILLLQGQGDLPRGALLGRISKVPELDQSETRTPEETAALTEKIGKFVLSVPNAEDGSEKPVCILSENQSTTGGDIPSVAYMTGEFLREGIWVGSDSSNKHDLTSWDVESALHERSIFLEKSIEP